MRLRGRRPLDLPDIPLVAGATPTPTATATPPPCAIRKADVDGDGVVSILDLAAVAGDFREAVPPAPAAYD